MAWWLLELTGVGMFDYFTLKAGTPVDYYNDVACKYFGDKKHCPLWISSATQAKWLLKPAVLIPNKGYFPLKST